VPTISGVDHIALTVSDLTVSLASYEDVLGLTASSTMTDGSFTRCVLALRGPTHLGLTQHHTGSGRGFDPTTSGLDHLGLACESREHLASWVEQLNAYAGQQNQLMLVLAGSPGQRWATVEEQAERLPLEHHSVVELGGG